tara:strand:- start:10025 stop:10348 length:324 start_codon:yes stop_codon:yes gene_type:complete
MGEQEKNGTRSIGVWPGTGERIDRIARNHKWSLVTTVDELSTFWLANHPEDQQKPPQQASAAGMVIPALLVLIGFASAALAGYLAFHTITNAATVAADLTALFSQGR